MRSDTFKDRNTILHNYSKFDSENFPKLHNFPIKDNNFMTNGKLYDQVDGVAMGSPLGPSIANMFMSALEDKYLNECRSHFKSILYRRYIDDTFCLFKNSSDPDLFFNHINNYHSNIKFTFEKESGNSLIFLDVLVHKDNDEQFSTS